MKYIPLLSILMLLIISGLIALLIALASKKDISGLKIMLLGINITLFGCIFAFKADFKIGAMEYLIAFLGLITSIAGLLKKD